MSINIDITFVISVHHKKKLYLALDKDNENRLSFFRSYIVEHDDTSTLVELKKDIREYVGENIASLFSCQVGIKMHEFVNNARATAYVEVMSKDQFRHKKLKLIAPEKAIKSKCTGEVDRFLYQFYKEKKNINLGDLSKED